MANKVYDPDGYDNRLREHGHERFVVTETPGILSPDVFYVREGEHSVRPHMWITVDKTVIRAGDTDAAIFRNIPRGARLRTFAASALLHEIVMQDDELELHIPVPCTYRVVFEKWPYRTFTVDVEAVA